MPLLEPLLGLLLDLSGANPLFLVCEAHHRDLLLRSSSLRSGWFHCREDICASPLLHCRCQNPRGLGQGQVWQSRKALQIVLCGGNGKLGQKPEPCAPLLISSTFVESPQISTRIEHAMVSHASNANHPWEYVNCPSLFRVIAERF